MRFLKYLIFIIISFLSSQVFAYYYVLETSLPGLDGKQFPSPQTACQAYASYFGWTYTNVTDGTGNFKYTCNGLNAQNNHFRLGIQELGEPTVCPDPGFPMYVYFDAGGKIPQQRCVPVQDKFCIYKSKPDSIILNHQNNRQSIVLYNQSKTPYPSCTPLDDGQCDKKDPYGGCYQPPNDGCTRLSDGSISCPDNDPPEIKKGCNGATYCDRPPTGCGTGYVSGSMNGQAVCVKSSPSTGTGGQGNGSGTGGDGSGSGSGTGGNGSGTGGDGSGSGSGTGGDGSGSGSGGGSTNINTGTGSSNINNSASGSGSSSGGSGGGGSSTSSFNIDLSPVVQAISALSDKLTWVKAELVNAVSRVEDKLTQTNSKLDSVKTSVDQTTQAVNANGDKIKSAVDANTSATNGVKSSVDANTNKLNDVIGAINNNKGTGNGNNGSPTDMKPTNDLLTEIKDFLTDKVDTSSLEEDLPVNDTPKQNLFSGSFGASPQCPPDVSLALPGLGSYVFSYDSFCNALQIAGYFVMIAAYLFAALIVSKA